MSAQVLRQAIERFTARLVALAGEENDAKAEAGLTEAIERLAEAVIEEALSRVHGSARR